VTFGLGCRGRAGRGGATRQGGPRAAGSRRSGRWLSSLESAALTITESQLALAALADLCAGSRESVEILKRLLRRARPTVLPRVG